MPRASLPVLLGLLLTGCGVPASAAGESGLVAAWTLVARHLPADARARLPKDPPADRESALAVAVVDMDRQPVTDERLSACIVALRDLARGDDEVAQIAGYLVGRIYQVHLFQPDPAKAAQAYEEVALRHPGSYWAQLALVKLALLDLFLLPQPAAPADRVAAAEALLPKVTDPALRRDLHLVLGRGRLFHRLPGVLPHLLEADRIGGLAGVARADLQLQIGELSRRAGEAATARRYFEAFLAENEVDPRVYAVRVKLASLAKGPGP
ncbi:MAG: hypothetical protein JSR48_10535 [Verrucomicrobia bacterium]|nr:hypothetical protein [Verrucomicrobiota bacterium]